MLLRNNSLAYKKVLGVKLGWNGTKCALPWKIAKFCVKSGGIGKYLCYLYLRMKWCKLLHKGSSKTDIKENNNDAKLNLSKTWYYWVKKSKFVQKCQEIGKYL